MTIIKKIALSIAAIFAAIDISFAQNPLFIPPTLSGTTFNLNIQNGTTQFYSGKTSK